MADYPLISIVLIGDCSIANIAANIAAIQQVDYPQDQLDYVLVVPFYRVLPSVITNQQKVNIIRFDLKSTWSIDHAHFQGWLYSQGDFVQFLDASYCIHPEWLKIGLSYLKREKYVAVRGNHPYSQKTEQRKDRSDVCLLDGFYNVDVLNQLYLPAIFGSSLAYPSQAVHAEEIHVAPEPMVTRKKQNSSLRSMPERARHRVMFGRSKYVLAC